MTMQIATTPRVAGGLAACLLLCATSTGAADRFVGLGGSDTGNTCLAPVTPCATIAAAVGQAGSGDTIKVARGMYRENVVLDVSTVVAIEGGWSNDFTVRDPALHVTTVDGGRRGRVFDVTADAGETIDLTLDGLVIARGGGDFPGDGVRVTAVGVLALTLTDCVLKANRGAGVGALSYLGSALELSVTRSAIRRNRGAGIAVQGFATATVTETTVERNRGSGGLKVTLYGGSLVVSGCTFSRNTNFIGGGGVDFASVDGTSSLTIDGSVFTRNRSDDLGGGVKISTGNGTFSSAITNSVLARNRSVFGGGGLHAVSGTGDHDLDVTNCTVVHNRGAGLRLQSEDGTLTANVTNTIAWDNSNPPGSPLDLAHEQTGGALTVNLSHSVLGPVFGNGTLDDLGGNLSVDPRLASLADAHLTASSPAIDAGTCAGAPATDFEGDPRPSGLGCDIGADEFAP